MHFCSTCQNLKIALPNFLVTSSSDVEYLIRQPICALGSLYQIKRRCSECPLCRLVFAAFRGGQIRPTTVINDLRSIAVFAKWISPLGPEKENRSRTTALYILVWPVSPQYSTGSYKVSIRAMSALLPDHPHFGRGVRKPLLDCTEIKTWLAHCESWHQSCNSHQSPGSPTRYFFLIDTQFMCIFRPTSKCRYLALSYVWGGVLQYKLTEHNLDALSMKFSLRPEHLTTTIRDAITLTRQLGERYLWVDTLCLIQDSTAIRQQTLQEMDRIYSQSVLIIVAGSSSSANDPLLGISKPREFTQWYQKVTPTLTLSAHFDFKDILEGSIYSRRAWTYQEYQVAQRLLIFAPDGHVYFSCKDAVFSEDIVPTANFDTDVAMLQAAESVRLRPDMRDPWLAYQRAVESYSDRLLTNQSDALDAFTGILRTIFGTWHVQGLPAAILDKALLWQLDGRHHRRSGFASWSWVGWKGRVRWLRNSQSGLEKEGPEIRTWIAWYSSSDLNCPTLAFFTYGPPRLHSSNVTNKARSRLFESSTRNHVPTPGLLSQKLRYNASSAPRGLNYLQFWTFVLRAEIKLDTLAVLKNSSLQAENTGNGVRKFIIFAEHNRHFGWILLDQSWIERLSSQPAVFQEFILLSETNSGAAGFNQNVFNTMMVVCSDGVMERVGLGQISDDEIGPTDVEWKEIILG